MIRPALFAGVALLAAALPALAHRFYVTLAEMEWNDASQRFEVALRVDDHNLEDAFRRTAGPGFQLRLNDADEERARQYVGRHFRLVSAGERVAPLHWVGWEWTTGTAWLYFEIEVEGDPEALTLHNDLFLELSKRQTNTVNLKLNDQRRTLTFQHGTERQRLSASD